MVYSQVIFVFSAHLRVDIISYHLCEDVLNCELDELDGLSKITGILQQSYCFEVFFIEHASSRLIQLLKFS